MRVHIGTDHAGFDLKKFLVAALTEDGHDVVDHGPHDYDPEDDYPVYCIPAAEAAVADPGSLGIVVGGSGNGEQIAANKVVGVRAALAYDLDTAKLGRQHNDANVISHRWPDAHRGGGLGARPGVPGHAVQRRRSGTPGGSGCWRSTRARAASDPPDGKSPLVDFSRSGAEIGEEVATGRLVGRASASAASPAVHPGEQVVDHFLGHPLVLGIGAGYVPRSHGTVQGDQPRGTVPPEIARP